MGLNFHTTVVNRDEDGTEDRFEDVPPTDLATRRRNTFRRNFGSRNFGFRDVIFTPLVGEPIKVPAVFRIIGGHKDGVPFASIAGIDVESLRQVHEAGVGSLTAVQLDALTKEPTHRIEVVGVCARAFVFNLLRQAFATAYLTLKASDRADIRPRFEIIPIGA